MPTVMQLVLTLRKEVPDRETGAQLHQLVVDRLADRPDIKITAHVTNHFDEVPPTP